MLEGLIEFSNKFALSSEDDVHIVMMETNTWVFYQCEPDIWMVVSLSNKPSRVSIPHSSNDSLPFHKHIPNGNSLLVAMKVSYIIIL